MAGDAIFRSCGSAKEALSTNNDNTELRKIEIFTSQESVQRFRGGFLESIGLGSKTQFFQ